ncbi:MAG TPA: class I SAM-dependent methyltransferase [Clostridiaceae bacterium]|nr:class I SAM-dependent methyltransferase [Clostridiaceae bacterium]
MSDFYAGEKWRAFDLGHPGGAESTKKLLLKGNVEPDDRILDLCCGAGNSVRLCSELGFDVSGVDRAPVIEHTRKNDHDHSYLVWESSGSEVARLPFEDGSFDVVLCECSLSLLEDKSAVMREVHRVLLHGGRFLVSDLYDGIPPDFEGFRRVWWEDATESLRSFIASWIWEMGTVFPSPSCRSGKQYFLGVYEAICK